MKYLVSMMLLCLSASAADFDDNAWRKLKSSQEKHGKISAVTAEDKLSRKQLETELTKAEVELKAALEARDAVAARIEKLDARIDALDEKTRGADKGGAKLDDKSVCGGVKDVADLRKHHVKLKPKNPVHVQKHGEIDKELTAIERELAEQAKLKDAKERGVKCDAIGRKTRKIGAEIDALESEIGGS